MTGLDRERNEHAADFFVIADVGLGFFLRAVPNPLRQNPDFEKMIWIEVNKIHVAIFPDHFDFVGRRSIDIFAAEIFNRTSFCFPIDQRPIDLGIFKQRLHVVRRHFLRIFASLERRNLPSFLTIVSLNRRHPLQRHFRAHFVGSLFRFRISKLELSFIDHHFAGQLERLQRAQRLRAAFRFNIFRD